jgi:hypothetical protein
MTATKLQKSSYKFRRVCSLEHFYILWPVGREDLRPLYIQVHLRVPTCCDSIANFELVCVGHDLSIPTGHKVKLLRLQGEEPSKLII